MINVWIDEMTPCLRNNITGELVDTEVVRIRRKSFLKKYNSRNGWYVNWAQLADECEIYALVIKGTVDIKGMVAIKDEPDFGAVYISWMCSEPLSNKEITSEPKYSGIGGHLFAIAAQKSSDFGYNGCIFGFASNQKLLSHYEKMLGAEYIGSLHTYHFVINEREAADIMEVYHYDWTDEEI